MINYIIFMEYKIDKKILYSLSESLYDDINLKINVKDIEPIVARVKVLVTDEEEMARIMLVPDQLSGEDMEAIKIINTIREVISPKYYTTILDYLYVIHEKRLNKYVDHSNKERKRVDELIEDPPIPNQNWVLLSFISPEKMKMKTNMRALKIRGVFATREKAEEMAKKLRQEVEQDFDIYVGELGRWLPWDTSEGVEKEDYAEKELNRLVKNHKDHLEKSKFLFEQRKKEELAAALKNNKTEKMKEKLRKKLKNKQVTQIPEDAPEINNLISEKDKAMIEEIEKGTKTGSTFSQDEVNKAIKRISEEEKKVNQEYEDLNKVRQDMMDDKKKIANIENEIKKYEEMYKKQG